MDTVLIIILLAFFIEQVFCFFLGSYPYRYGFLVNKITIPTKGIILWKDALKKCHVLKLSINEHRQEMYFRYKYPFGIAGPYLFTAQAKFSAPEILLIRIGPCASLLVIYIITTSIIEVLQSGNYFDLLNMVFLFGAVLVFYFLLLKSLKELECK